MTTSPEPIWQSLLAMRHNAPMRRALPFIFLAFSCVLAGCGEKAVQLPQREKIYHSIVSLSPGTSEIVASDGDPQTLKGRTASCDWPPNIMAHVPIVANVKPDYERIQQIAPDLIVYDPDLYSAQDIDKLKATGAELFAFDAETVESFMHELYTLGSKLGQETRFNDYGERIRVEQQNALASPFNPPPKVAIVMPNDDGKDYIAGTDGFLGDLVKTAGGKLLGPSGKIFVPLNAEAFVALNPDVIIVGGTKADMRPAQSLVADPRFKTINAIKNDKVRAIDSDVLYRKGQRVDTLVKDVHLLIGSNRS